MQFHGLNSDKQQTLCPKSNAVKMRCPILKRQTQVIMGGLSLKIKNELNESLNDGRKSDCLNTISPIFEIQSHLLTSYNIA